MTLTLSNLPKILKSKPYRRLGRGIGSGRGKTAGRGTKGQRARSGSVKRISLPNLPKLRGFKSRGQKPITINWQKLKDKKELGDKINRAHLIKLKIIKKNQKYKIVGRSDKNRQTK